MSRSRLSFSVDQDNHIFILRYFGDIEGGEINTSLMEQLTRVTEPWTFDSIIDMRRYSGVVMAQEIQELGMRWGLLAQGRDQDRLTALISEDPLVKARFGQTQAAFPYRRMELFSTFDEGLEWIDSERTEKRLNVA